MALISIRYRRLDQLIGTRVCNQAAQLSKPLFMNNYKQENREHGLRFSFPLVLFTSRSRFSLYLFSSECSSQLRLKTISLRDAKCNRSESSSYVLQFEPIVRHIELSFAKLLSIRSIT